MPRLSEKAFSDKYLSNLKPRPARYDVFDAAQRALGIRVAPTGTKTWFVMRRMQGRMRRVTLGRYPEMPLSKARIMAGDVLEQLAEGTYSLRSHVPPSFRDLLEQWLKRDQSQNRAVRHVKRILEKDVLPVLGEMPIDTITARDIRRILDRIVDRGAAVHANRVRAYLVRLFNWAVEQEHLDASPCRTVKPPTKERSRSRVLTLDELQAIWHAAGQLGYPFGPLYQLLILTGQRRGEAASAEWHEVDLELGLWMIPGTKAKNGRDHIVHLCPRTIEVLAQVPRLCGQSHLFSTTGSSAVSGFSKAKRRLDALCPLQPWVVHDIRRSVATHMAETLSVSPVVVDRILNHASGAVTGVAAIYQRGEYLKERETALAQWSQYLLSDVEMRNTAR